VASRAQRLRIERVLTEVYIDFLQFSRVRGLDTSTRVPSLIEHESTRNHMFQVARFSFFKDAVIAGRCASSSAAGPLSLRSNRHHASRKPVQPIERFVGLVPEA